MRIYVHAEDNATTFNKKNYLVRASQRLGLDIFTGWSPGTDTEYVLNIEPYSISGKGSKWTGERGEVISADIGMFNRSIDEGGSAELKFGETTARMLLSSRFHKREIEMVVMWDDEVSIYDIDDATHFDVLRNYLDNDNYLKPMDAVPSLELAEKIYQIGRMTDTPKLKTSL